MSYADGPAEVPVVLSPERLAEIVARLEAATPGPWRVERDEPTLSRFVVDADGLLTIDFGYVGNANQPDARFVAHAREDVPALLAEVDRLRVQCTAGVASEQVLQQQIDGQGAEVDRLRAELAAAHQRIAALEALAADATEYRVLLPDGGGSELRVSRCRSGIAAGAWAVAVPGWGGGRAWTLEGWQDSISALTVDRLFCWPTAVTAIAAARRALGGGERR